MHDTHRTPHSGHVADGNSVERDPGSAIGHTEHSGQLFGTADLSGGVRCSGNRPQSAYRSPVGAHGGAAARERGQPLHLAAHFRERSHDWLNVGGYIEFL